MIADYREHRRVQANQSVERAVQLFNVIYLGEKVSVFAAAISVFAAKRRNHLDLKIRTVLLIPFIALSTRISQHRCQSPAEAML